LWGGVKSGLGRCSGGESVIGVGGQAVEDVVGGTVEHRSSVEGQFWVALLQDRRELRRSPAHLDLVCSVDFVYAVDSSPW
jgi:hypothetical protein